MSQIQKHYQKLSEIQSDLHDNKISVWVRTFCGGRRYSIADKEFSLKELIHHALTLAKRESKGADSLNQILTDLTHLDNQGAELLKAQETKTIAKIFTVIRSLFGNLFHGKKSGFESLRALIRDTKLTVPLSETEEESASPFSKQNFSDKYTEGAVSRAWNAYSLDDQAVVSQDLKKVLELGIIAQLTFDDYSHLVGRSGKRCTQQEVTSKVRYHLKRALNMNPDIRDLTKSQKAQFSRDLELIQALNSADYVPVAFTKAHKYAFAEAISRGIAELPLSHIGNQGSLVLLDCNNEIKCKTIRPLLIDETNGIQAAVLLPVDPKGADKDTVQIVFQGTQASHFMAHNFAAAEKALILNLKKLLGKAQAPVHFQLFGLGTGGCDAQRMCASLASHSEEFKIAKIDVYGFNPQPIELSLDQEFYKQCLAKDLEFNAHYFKTEGDLAQMSGQVLLGMNHTLQDWIAEKPSKSSLSVLKFAPAKNTDTTPQRIPEKVAQIRDTHWDYVLIPGQGNKLYEVLDCLELKQDDKRDEKLNNLDYLRLGTEALCKKSQLKKDPFGEGLKIISIVWPDLVKRMSIATAMTPLKDFAAFAQSETGKLTFEYLGSGFSALRVQLGW